MGCDVISSDGGRCTCPNGYVPYENQTGPYDANPSLLPEYQACIQCAQDDPCKMCYDLGQNPKTNNFPCTCVDPNGVLGQVSGSGVVNYVEQCYECAAADPLPPECSPPPPPPPPPSPPPPVPTDCINGGDVDGGQQN